jgi:hypothetical protein
MNRGLPFGSLVLRLGQHLDITPGIEQRDKVAAIGSPGGTITRNPVETGFGFFEDGYRVNSPSPIKTKKLSPL